MTFLSVLVTEFVKLHRSKVPWFSLAALSLGPLSIALFMWIVQEPERAEQLGLLGAKADLAGISPTWPSFTSMLTLVIGMGGMLLLSFIVAFTFGREYAEGTAKNLLALPVARHWFVFAKFTVTAVWWLALVSAVLVEGLVVGLALALPGLTPGLALAAVRDALLAAGFAFLLVPVVAWIATLGRGYLPPLGFAFAILALGNVFAKTGWAEWFPWSIVPLMIGTVGEPTQRLPLGSLVVVALTSVAGIGATVAQVRYADNTQ